MFCMERVQNFASLSLLPAGENILGTAVSGTEIEVTWDQPANLYFQPNGTLGSSPALSGAMYELCVHYLVFFSNFQLLTKKK